MPMLTSLLAAAVLGLLGGAALGFFIGRRHARARHGLVRPGRRPAIPGLREGLAVWVLPGHDLRAPAAAALAARGALGCPTLLLPRPAERSYHRGLSAGPPGLAWLDEERPTSAQVLRAAASICPGGPMLLVVEGAPSLEQVSDDEPADAVLKELVEQREDRQALVILLLEGEQSSLEPTARLVPVDQGLALESGELLLRSEGQGFRLVEG